MNTRTRNLVSIAIATGLIFASCGGSGGGGGAGPAAPTGTIDEQDAVELASITRSIGGLIGLADFAAGIAQEESPPAFQGGGGPEVEACPDGGTVTYTFTDAAPTGELSAGDFFEIEFADCTTVPTTVNGHFSFFVTLLTQDKSLVSVAMTFLIDQLTVVDSGTTFGQSGTLSQTFEYDTLSGDFGYTLSGFLDSSYSEGGSPLTATLSGLALGFDYIADLEIQALRFNCTYQSSVASDTNFTVTTITDLVAYGIGNNPTEGQLSIAAGVDTLYMTAQPDGVHVLLELDRGDDGSIDWSELVPWDEL